MAYGFNKPVKTAVLGTVLAGAMALGMTTPSWASGAGDYTQRNGANEFNVSSFQRNQPQGMEYMQMLQNANGIQGMAQGNLGQGLMGGLMNGNIDFSQFAQQMVQQVAQQMVQQAVGQLLSNVPGLENFGGLTQGLAGGVTNGIFGNTGGMAGGFGNSGMGGFGGLNGGGLNGIGGFASGGIHGGLAGGGINIGGIVNGAINGAINGLVNQGISAITQGMGGGGVGNGSGSFNNNFGGAAGAVGVIRTEGMVNTTNANYDAGINAALTGGMSSAYAVMLENGTLAFDIDYKAGYDKAKALMAAGQIAVAR